MEPTDLLAPDLQSSKPEVQIGLSRVGVRGVSKAIRLRRGPHEKLVEHIARTVVGRQQALRAEVEVTARYPLERETPVTKMRTQEMVSLIGIAAASATSARRVVGV